MQPLFKNIKKEPGFEEDVKIEIELTPLKEEVPAIKIKEEFVVPKKKKYPLVDITRPAKSLGGVKKESLPRRLRKNFNFYSYNRTYGWDPQPSPINPKLFEWRKNSLFKIGIWDKCFMSSEKLKKLKRAIIDSLMKCEDGGAPSIYECIEQNGWLQISFKDQQGIDWICLNITHIKPWPEANFALRYCNDVRNNWEVMFTVSNSYVNTGREVVTLLKKQNEGLNVDEWGLKLVKYSPDCITVNFELTEEQIDELRNVNYSPMVGFMKANVNVTPNKIYCTADFISTLDYNSNFATSLPYKMY